MRESIDSKVPLSHSSHDVRDIVVRKEPNKRNEEAAFEAALLASRKLQAAEENIRTSAKRQKTEDLRLELDSMRVPMS
jgi:hypothetical protein